jgi:hypothetical protein
VYEWAFKAEQSKFSPPALSFKKTSPDTQTGAVAVGTNYAQTLGRTNFGHDHSSGRYKRPISRSPVSLCQMHAYSPHRTAAAMDKQITPVIMKRFIFTETNTTNIDIYICKE